MFSNKQKPLPAAILKAPKRSLPTTPVEGDGVKLGDNAFWNPTRASNPHLAIIGTSGSGKTQTLKAIAHEIIKQNIAKVIILDFHGDQELPGEACYELSMATTHGINPLQVNMDKAGGGPALQAIAVASTLKRSLQMGANQEGLVLEVLKDCYLVRGISQNDYSTWNKEPPNFSDFQDEIDSRAEDGCKESQKLRLKLAATFQYGIFSRPQPDWLATQLTRIDLSKLPPEIGAIAAESLAKQMMDNHRLDGEVATPRTFIMIDEAKELKGSPSLDRILADGRKYGLGVLLASQSERHFSLDILSNSACKIVLSVDQTEVKKVSSKFRFDEKRVATLQPLDALIRIGTTAIASKIIPYYQRI